MRDIGIFEEATSIYCVREREEDGYRDETKLGKEFLT